MQITADQIQDGDIVMDAEGAVWRKIPFPSGDNQVPYQTLQDEAGKTGAGDGPAVPAGTLTLLVRGGQQMCCTPTGATPPA